MIYAKLINENEIEIASKNYKGIFNFSSNEKIMKKHGFYPLVQTKKIMGRAVKYIFEDDAIKEVLREFTDDELEKYKEQKKYFLWKSFKQYQQKYVDAEDLILASMLSINGNQKGTAVRNWVQNLWLKYYEEKNKIESLTPSSNFGIINYDPSVCGFPTYSIYELNQEVLKGVLEDGK